jgi:hypothetical protein
MKYFHLPVERHRRAVRLGQISVHIVRTEEHGLLQSYCGQLNEMRRLCTASDQPPATLRLCESCRRAAAAASIHTSGRDPAGLLRLNAAVSEATRSRLSSPAFPSGDIVSREGSRGSDENGAEPIGAAPLEKPD